jgi:hypothetical protein
MDRRHYPRVHAPVFCRPTGKPLFGRREAKDVSPGGARIYADEAPPVGDRLELEMLLPGDARELVCQVEVVWVEALPAGGAARYDVGVKFVEIAPQDLTRLEAVLRSE